jgi:hypothetical protein
VSLFYFCSQGSAAGFIVSEPRQTYNCFTSAPYFQRDLTFELDRVAGAAAPMVSGAATAEETE